MTKTPSRNRKSLITTLAAALVAGALTTGCDTAPDGAEDVGTIRLELQKAPSDGQCLRLTVDSAATGLKVVKLLGLVPDTASQMQVGSLPVGSVGLVGEVFNVVCGSVTAATPMTWVSNKLTVTVMPDFTQTVTLTLLKAGKVNLGVDFVANTQVEEIKLSLPVTALAAAPSGTMLMTMASSGYVWQLSTPFNMTTVGATSLGSDAGFLAAAADGNIAVTTTSDTKLVVMSSAGVVKSTLNLGFTAGGLVVDTAGVGWVGSMSSPTVMRVANVAGATAPSMLAITAGSISAPGIGLATNGTPRVGAASPGVLLTLTAAGSITNTLSPPIVPRGIAGQMDGSLYILGFNTGNNVYKVTAAGVITPAYSMVTAPTRAAIASTPKGVVVGSTSGGLVLFKADGTPQNIQLPGNAVPGTIAVSKADGRVWVGDSTSSRILVVTLP